MPSLRRLSLIAAALAATALPAMAGGPASFADARRDAAAKGVPLLLDFATSW